MLRRIGRELSNGVESQNIEFKSNWRDDTGGELWNMSRKVSPCLTARPFRIKNYRDFKSEIEARLEI
jgi:hypothetical protein